MKVVCVIYGILCVIMIFVKFFFYCILSGIIFFCGDVVVLV